MRDYVSRMVKNTSDIVAHPSTVRAMLVKRPAYIAAAFLIVLVVIFVALRAVKADSNTPVSNNVINKTSIETTTKASPVVTDDTPQAVAEGEQGTMTTPENESQSSTQTNVTVNGQQVDVPKNGNVSKTIQSENGKTTVNITSSSNSTNGGSNTTNSLNVNTFSQSAGAASSQVNRYIP